jgi:hypothetical protein
MPKSCIKVIGRWSWRLLKFLPTTAPVGNSVAAFFRAPNCVIRPSGDNDALRCGSDMVGLATRHSVVSMLAYGQSM